jgi:hypothetical protein
MEFLHVNQTYTSAGKTRAFLLMVLLSGLPWWFIDYNTYLNFPIFTIVSVVIIAFSAGHIKANTRHKKREIILVAMSAHQVALIIKILIDSLTDPTDHNMAPFEMLMIMFMDAICCIISVFIGAWFKLPTAKK